MQNRNHGLSTKFMCEKFPDLLRMRQKVTNLAPMRHGMAGVINPLSKGNKNYG